MQKYYLTEITTKDKLIHQGLFYRSSKQSKRAILWVHGLTDNFYGDIPTFETFMNACEKEGWGFASFNTRGHDIIASGKKLDPKSPKGHTSVSIGSSVERFSDCLYDIDAAVTFLEQQGFKEVILIGISTGANKVCYYAGKSNDPRVAGVVLASPISDVTLKLKELGKRYPKVMNKISQLVKKGRGERLMDDLDYMPLTPKRFLSLYTKNSEEDVFPYYQKNPIFKVFSKINIPLVVVFGGADEYSDRPTEEILRVFESHHRSSNFSGVIIPGAFHSYGGKETQLISKVVEWIKTL